MMTTTTTTTTTTMTMTREARSSRVYSRVDSRVYSLERGLGARGWTSSSSGVTSPIDGASSRHGFAPHAPLVVPRRPSIRDSRCTPRRSVGERIRDRNISETDDGGSGDGSIGGDPRRVCRRARCRRVRLRSHHDDWTVSHDDERPRIGGSARGAPVGGGVRGVAKVRAGSPEVARHGSIE